MIESAAPVVYCLVRIRSEKDGMRKYSVTIAREYGSGGRIIGRRLAEELGIAFYDRELIAAAARETGLAEDYVQEIEQGKTAGFLYSSYIFIVGRELPVPEQVFIAQSGVIRDIAERESCVLIGRCADYVLRDSKNCARIFIHAPFDWRVSFARSEYRESEKNLEEYVRRQDKNRASYYDFFTHKKWGRARNYDICIDSSIGIPASVAVLRKFVEEFKLARGDD
ncbi:MAG: cytidylate kinase-like family protein [Synergistaceae bacterium]|jgi:cytidylate kinase|nr:cytidylate kinase-like family protein [Synergistaceae bacterium]